MNGWKEEVEGKGEERVRLEGRMGGGGKGGVWERRESACFGDRKWIKGRWCEMNGWKEEVEEKGEERKR